MKNLRIAGSHYTPEVIFDAVNGILSISGECYHSGTLSLFDSAMEWLDEYFSTPERTVIFNFRVSYFNTSASRQFYRIIQKLENYYLNHLGDVRINWYFQNSMDNSIREQGEEFKEDLQVPFHLIEFDKYEERNLIHRLNETEVRLKKLQNIALKVDEQKVALEDLTNALRKKNKEIKEQREKIEAQNQVITQKNKELQSTYNSIQGSISYAERIQQAMLPDEKLLTDWFSEAFIMLKPRDIVSGDFYWFTKTEPTPIFEEIQTPDGKLEKKFKYFEPEKIILATVDCTGHGIPGAFMSILGIELLDKIINEKNIYHSDEILKELDNNIKHSLRSMELVRDGMDIAVMVVDFSRKIIEFSGARMPLVYLRNNRLFYIRGDKYSIGSLPESEKFTKSCLDISTPMSIYFFSDGFYDQFGEATNRKFMLGHFRDLLFAHHQKSFTEQKEIFEQVFQEWKGKKEQTDDLLVMGVKIP